MSRTWKDFHSWLEAEVGLSRDEYLRLPLSKVICLLREPDVALTVSNFPDASPTPGPKKPKPRRRGRPKTSPEIVTSELNVYSRWQSYRRNGGHGDKRRFAREEAGLSLSEFDKLLDRVGKRIRREDKFRRELN